MFTYNKNNKFLFNKFFKLENNPQYHQYYELLKLFAYGNYRDYLGKLDIGVEISVIFCIVNENFLIAKENSLPPLSANSIMKLRHLSIVSLASKCRTIPYRTLCEHLGIDNIRELEDLIIEAFYADVLKGTPYNF